METTDTKMTPDEFRRLVIEPVTKALNKNSTQTKIVRAARHRAAKRKIEHYNT